jgi:tetratricopeptide (TPR) repeat protein
MGLLGDALSEFRAAMKHPARRIDCLHMMGLCTLDQGQAGAAVQHFEEALAAKEVTPEQLLAVRFELGRAFEALGDRVRARSAFEAVAAIDPSFCNVEEFLERVDDESKPEAPEAEADFESFDDLMGEAAESGDAPDAGQENFDDVIAEANDEEVEPDVLEAPLDDEPAPPVPAPRVAAKPGRAPAAKSARKKKISFV